MISKKSILFSIIIPVYNVQNYLKECLDSIVQQQCQTCEIILVNDGSTDKSGEICKTYKEKYDFIKLVEKTNGGLASARNSGLSCVTGKYVVFWDSDDFMIGSDFLANAESFIQKHEMLDMIVFGFTKYYENSNTYRDVSMSSWAECDVVSIETAIMKNMFQTSACGKFIKRELFEQHDLLFREGVISEDMDWCMRLALCASNVGMIKHCAYAYRYREGSLSHSLTTQSIYELETNINRSIEVLNRSGIKEKDCFYSYLSQNFSIYLISLAKMKRKEWQTHIPFLKEKKYLLKYAHRSREKIFNLAIHIVREKITLELLRILLYYKK